MKYSLRSLMIVVLVAPPVLTGLWGFGRPLFSQLDRPTLRLVIQDHSAMHMPKPSP